jgi:hypothetical protein
MAKGGTSKPNQPPTGVKGSTIATISCPCRKPIRLASEAESSDACLMRDVCSLIWLALVGLFHSRVSWKLRFWLSLSETQSCWQLISNRAMLLPYARGL